jgi:hypothetical protein
LQGFVKLELEKEVAGYRVLALAASGPAGRFILTTTATLRLGAVNGALKHGGRAADAFARFYGISGAVECTGTTFHTCISIDDRGSPIGEPVYFMRAYDYTHAAARTPINLELQSHNVLDIPELTHNPSSAIT